MKADGCSDLDPVLATHEGLTVLVALKAVLYVNEGCA